jgi:hypothetical protein
MRANSLLGLLLLLASATSAAAIVHENPPGRFDHLVQHRNGGVVMVEAAPVWDLPDHDPARQAWNRVAAERGGQWRVWLDERSGLPTLALVRGKSWVAERDAGSSPIGPDLEQFATRARIFLRESHHATGNWDDQIVLDREASGPRGPDTWQVRFAQVVDGVRVEGARFDFHVSHGNLVALGAGRWAPVRISTAANLNAAEARYRLDVFVRWTDDDGIVDLADPELILVPVAADPSSRGAWRGPRGAGLAHRLIWRFRFTDSDAIATWTGEVDAHTGEIVAFYDDTRYDRIKGHVNPISDDGQCHIGGCPEPGFPLPYVGYTEDGGAVQYANPFGLYECTTPGSTIETTLSGRYFWINDQCGPILESTTCHDELDLGVAQDNHCNVAPGASAGNTDAARSAYYSLNAVARKARFWMPGNAWLDTSVECRTNVGGTCNAFWSGGVINMYGPGSGCGNTGQLQGLVVHEWGHGLNDFDGGGADNPSEAYSDIIAIFEARESCVARGYGTTSNCDGYGDTCLGCTGLREMDWDARAAHTPATPSGYLAAYCPIGGGPCGKEIHCESHLASEVIYDLATRDLPAMGVDTDTAWQLAERLWYQSRPGSGGDAYNCTIDSSDSCSVGSWYHQLRVQDDDDGDLTNGTPHAAAIFAAFDRHDIACGTASDPENQNTSSCPTLAAPVVTFTAQTDAVALDWDPVTGASAYRVYRNEIGCQRAQFPVAEVAAPTTSLVDDGLANGLPVFYRVQAIGANAACESPVSSCIEAAAQELAGRVRFGKPAYGCSQEIELEVTDLNHPSSSMMVTVWSDTEPTPETVTLNETSVGSARFTGSIFATTSAPASDGMLSIADGDTITAEYVDLDDGEGGVNVARQSVAHADCVAPTHTSVTVNDITETGARIDWTTSKSTSGVLEWGTTPALGNVIQRVTPGTDHTANIGPFTACGRVYFRITSTDLVGHVAIADVQGAPFEFNAFAIQGILHEDGFETDTGWTLQGDWEIDVPQGLGTVPGDPVSASEGVQVLGQDLSGLGANPGDYEFNTTYSATSPVIDASSLSNVELRFERWLNYNGIGSVALYVKDAGGFWRSVWNSSSGLTESSWVERSYDVTSWAAGNPTLQIRFEQTARYARDAGWNVDRLMVRDGSLPLHGSCGGCGGAPTFAGVVSAADLDPCQDSGVLVSWAAAPAWGTGSSGTYSVYRDTAPGFTPSAVNLVASGVAGPSWTDATAPTDIELYYVVRAENDETCSTGPNNGGMTDGNLVYASTVNAAGQGSAPGPVGNTLLVDPAGGFDVRLSWSAVIDATGYNVYRSAVPDTGFAVIGQPTTTTHDDPGALSNGQSWYYLITATSTCGESED